MGRKSSNSSAVGAAYLLSTARVKAGKSQEYMAEELGVARKTIQNWEKGVSVPSLDRFMAWFEALGTGAWPYVMQYIYPRMQDIDAEKDDAFIRSCMVDLVKEMSSESLRQLMYLCYGDHGSSPRAILNLMTAHLQTPMRDRVSQAAIILNNYEVAEKKGELARPDHIKPNIELLHAAYEHGKIAVYKNESAYNLKEPGLTGLVEEMS